MQDSETPPRDVTVDEAVVFAIQLQKRGQLGEAQELYRRVLDVAPNHPDALHYSGVLAHQQGHSDKGLALIHHSLAVAPGRADCYNNLGIILQSTGNLDAAIEAYQQAITIDQAHANAHSNLGVLLRATGKPVEAEAAYRTAIRIDPGHIDAFTNLGILLHALNRTREATECYCKVITLRPKHREARRLLALAHCVLGDVDEAITIFDEWLAEDPGDPIALHMRAACAGQNAPARASNGYVEKTFDSFAASFEAKLAQLSYRAPALIAAMLDDSSVKASKQLDVLDAGCGTGLCGPLLAPYAWRLTGVDLSEGMLALAKEKKVYDALIRGELTEYLRSQPAVFDVIVSADALVYFGGLESVVEAAAAALRPNGLLVFTLEHAVDGAATDWRLELHGRYSHARGYVERVLAAFGLDPFTVPAELRMESGAPVAGLVVRGTKPASM